eukprot:11549544-Heterocapsa_arctica.AAC.1
MTYNNKRMITLRKAIHTVNHMKYNEQEKAMKQLRNDKETTTCKEDEDEYKESERRGQRKAI